MRILHLISQRPDSTGSGIYLQEILKAGAHYGHSNILLSAIPAGAVPALDHLPLQHVEYLEFGTPRLPFPIAGMSDVMPYASSRFQDLSPEQIGLYEDAFSHSLQQLVERFKPDLIHSHHLWLLSSLARRLFPQLPLVTSCHGSDLRQFELCPGLQEQVLTGCTAIPIVMALSKEQKAHIHNLYGIPRQRIEVVGGGYNPELFYAGPKVLPPPVRLLYAGKLSRAKGVPYLLKALKQLSTDDYHLDLFGSGAGEEYQTCLQLAARLGKRITLHGAVSHADLAEQMRNAHAMILPSLFEGLPLIMLEAVGSGCRVLSTDLPGPREIQERLKTPLIQLVPLPILEHVDQLAAEHEQPFIDSLQDQLESVIAATMREPEPDLAPLQNGLAHYSWKQVSKRIDAVYRDALSS